ncbi:MAG: ribonuclease R [Hyphomonadaceae bacterium]|nr:MAG: ribonuclease R [Hyphomonadaceae bacterium]
MSKKIIKKRHKHASAPSPALDKKSLLAFLGTRGGMATKREIVAAFGIKGEDRRILNSLLRELDGSGELSMKKRRDVSAAGAPPKSGIFQAVEIDEHGDLWAKQIGEDGPIGEKYLVQTSSRSAGGGAVGINERFVGIAQKSDNAEDGQFVIKVIKRLGVEVSKIFGVLHIETGQEVGRIIPADRKTKFEIMVMPQHLGKAKNGDLVSLRLLPNRGQGIRKGEIIDVLGNVADPKSASILAIAAHNIPIGFSTAEEKEAEAALTCSLEYRKDLREIPFVTIDPEDARDHDDAVYARPSANGGHIIMVAIADVAHYVRPNTALDNGARMRGNSVYFPDRVVPMLPFRLSADLCSLGENEVRPCLAVEIRVDKHGTLQGFEFCRGLMKSVASLSYHDAQSAIDGKLTKQTAPILENVLKPLWAAYEALKIERASRIPLEIESNERKIVLGENGKVESITTKERFDAHKLIEEFMILANVCAATAIENKHKPLIFRVHDRPSETKIAALGDFLATLNIKWTKGEVATPKRFNRILEIAKEGENFQTINEMVLRSQAQAIYDVNNIGHFGLQLHKYAHFTSPIRRYADLTVHRTLIDVLELGGNNYESQAPAKTELQNIAREISDLERRAMAAERDATDRYLAAYLSDRVGAIFEGRITSVTNFGVFVRLDETMGDGLVPVSHLGDEYFFLDEGAATLIGQYSGDRWQLGMRVQVRLLEATPISGGLMFDMVSDPKKGPAPKGRMKTGRDFRRGPSSFPKGVRRGKRR